MRTLVPLLALPLALASCGAFGTPQSFDVTGTLSGTAPGGGDVRLAFVGVGFDGVVNSSVAQIDLTLGSKGVFAADFPATPAEGAYQVIAYVDADGDKKYDVGEARTKNNQKYLVYSSGGAISTFAGLGAGWNLVNTATNPPTVSQPGRITGYDLGWS